MNLNAHLRGHIGLPGSHSDLASFFYIVGKRLLTIDMLAEPECRQRGKGVRVFTGTDDHRIKQICMVKHAAQIRDCVRPRILLSRFLQIAFKHIAQHGNFVAFGDRTEVAVSPPSSADHGNPQPVVGTLRPQ